MPKRILFLYNQVTEAERIGPFGECALEKDVEKIKQGLIRSNNEILTLDLFSPEQLEEFIKRNQPIDMAFVIAEGFKDLPHTLYNGQGAALVRKYLSKYNIPSSHSSVESMEICRNKDWTYAKLRENIPVPEFLVFYSHFSGNMDALYEDTLKIGYPLMVKPAGGGNSIGISSKSVVYNFLALKKQITYLNETLGPSTLIIEKYLSGQEFTLGILGNEIKYVLPIIGFPWDFGVRDANLKKVENKLRHKFEIINEYDQRFKKLLEIGINTFDAVLANDIIRIDIKEDADGNPYVIDVNGTPSLATSGSLSYMAQQAKISHSDLINLTLYETLTRYGLKPNMFLEEHILELQSKLTQFNSIEVA